MLVADVFADARYGWRSMLKSPGFTLAAVTSLALGVAATTAIFSVASAVLLQSLPYRDPARLASVSLDGAVTAPLFEAFQQQARSLERAALFVNASFNLTGEGRDAEPVRVQGARVSADLFAMLGVQPRLGRGFTAEEDRTGGGAVVLISDGLWRSRFGADPHIVGRTVTLDGAPHTIIGVMPPHFQFPYGPELPAWAGSLPPADLWRPVALLDWERTCAGCFNFGMIARLRPGVDAARVRAELTGIVARTYPRYTPGADHPLSVVTLKDAVTAKVRTPITILLGAVALALLIACANVANLLLARGLQRQGELALRLSLGATPLRLYRQLITESVMLGLCAAALGIPLAWAGTRAFVALAPEGIPRLDAVGLNPGMLAFALGVTLLSAFAFGAAPALLASRHAPGEALVLHSRRATPGRARLRAALVVAEVAVSVVLLVGAGLLARSFANVARTPLGFRTDHVLTLRIPFAGWAHPGDSSRTLLVERLTANVAALPGVVSAAAVSTLPLTGESEGWSLHPADDPERSVMTRIRAITPGYFRTLGIRLQGGREFGAEDRGTTQGAIVSATAARRLWPGVADPVGRRIGTKDFMTVVGVVDDTHASGLDAEIRPYLYVPFRQFTPREFALAIHTSGDPAPLVRAVQQEVWRLDKNLPVTRVETMRQLVADSIAPRRFPAVLMALFGGFALVLAAVGIHGILSYAVAQRTHEFGIRMALGATRQHVLAAVLRQAGLLLAGGLAIGLVAAAVLAPLMRGLLYGLAPSDVLVYAGGAAVLAGVAALASVNPARRAVRLDPMACLRYE